MINPEISVVIPLYNKEKYVDRAVRSLLEQSFSNFEAVVIDDGSTDAGADVVRSFADPRIRLMAQENQGVSAARNRGIVEARAEYVAFLDADDAYMPQFLQTLWQLKERFPDGRFFASAFEVVYPDGRKTVRDFGHSGSCSVDLLSYLECCVRMGSPVVPSAVIAQKAFLEKIGMFPVGQKRGEDLDTWVRMLLEAPLIYHNTPSVVHWDSLPLSVCVTSNDVYLRGNRVLEMLEEKMEQEHLVGSDRESVLDYIAWYMAGPVDRLIAGGNGAEARKYIYSAFRSKRLRTRFLLRFLKSWCAPLGRR